MVVCHSSGKEMFGIGKQIRQIGRDSVEEGPVVRK